MSGHYSGAERRGGTYFYCLEPARLLDLVVDDRLVLVDALVSGTREDHVLEAHDGGRKPSRRLTADSGSGKKEKREQSDGRVGRHGS